MQPTDALIEHPRNPNTHPDEQIQKLVKVIEMNGWRAPIVVSKRSGFITKGHGRLQAARLAGWKKVPVEIQEYETEAAEYADMIADNKIAELAVGDDEKLKSLVLELNGQIDLAALGMADSDLSEFLQPEIVEEKENPNSLVERSKELGEKWGVKRGDIYQIGGQHRLMCGDSTSQANVESLMDGKQAELLMTDPPYLVNYTGARPDNNVLWEEGEDWDSSENVELYKTFLQVAYSHAIVESAPLYVWHAGKAGSQLLREAFAANGILEHLTIIWVKNKPVISFSWYAWQHEPCLMGWKQGCKPKRKTKYSGPTVWKFLQDGGDLNKEVDFDALPTVWEIDCLSGKERPEHPTPKPPQLFMIPMRQHTDLGAICYEPFAGSGSQIIAASIMKRKCYAMELSEKYCGVILERCVNYGLKVKKI
jgi:DNA modification methylase